MWRPAISALLVLLVSACGDDSASSEATGTESSSGPGSGGGDGSGGGSSVAAGTGGAPATTSVGSSSAESATSGTGASTGTGSVSSSGPGTTSASSGPGTGGGASTSSAGTGGAPPYCDPEAEPVYHFDSTETPSETHCGGPGSFVYCGPSTPPKAGCTPGEGLCNGAYTSWCCPTDCAPEPQYDLSACACDAALWHCYERLAPAIDCPPSGVFSDGFCCP